MDFTPTMTSMTRMVLSRAGSMAAPHIILALGLMREWTSSTTFWASVTVMSGPPVTFTRAPLASEMSTSRSGELMAMLMASVARSSSLASPRPIIATPPERMMVLMSLKSRLTRPGLVMISVMPLMERMSTSSATLKAALRGNRGLMDRSLSLGITMAVSTR